MKRTFDFVVSLITLLAIWYVLVVLILVAAIDTGAPGIFSQARVGRYGKIFMIYKIRSMALRNGRHYVTRFGNFLRNSKLDELPQFWNVLVGDMSLVGPRPDLPGYYDNLQGEDRKILELRPGITSLASIKYKDEEHLLAAQTDPLFYNDTVIFPDKVKMNLDYYHNRTFGGDLKVLWYTVFGRRC